jgi:hypothetical protein
MPKIIDYCPELKIHNTGILPRGSGAKFLLAIESIYLGEYVAKRWLRKMPVNTHPGEVVIRF